MKRIYATGESSTDPKFFIGKEVEHTSAFGKKTLFCHGEASLEEIKNALEKNLNILHVYLNLNHTDCIGFDEKLEWLLGSNFLVTLELQDAKDIKVNNHSNFIQILSIKIDNFEEKSFGLFLKIDDKDFAYSNEGVWTGSVFAIKKQENLTLWDEYKNDEII